jgi:branched-chain amino acid aminotransferase
MPTLYALSTTIAQGLTLPDMSSFDALSRQLPQGLYSTFRTYADKTKVLGLQAHLDRLYNPTHSRGVPMGRPYVPLVTAAELRHHLRVLLSRFGPGEARVRISLATVESPGQVFLMLEPLKLPAETAYQRGVRVVLSHAERVAPRLKSTVFIENSARERQFVAENDAFEGLIVRNGKILEGLTSNFFVIRQGKVITAEKDILLGVTRHTVLRLARANGLELELRSPRVDELPTVEEAFISSSSRGIVPVVQIDGQPVGTGQVGEGSTALRRAYESYVATHAERI